MTHDLKTLPEPFQAVWDGRKSYEIRVNDRGYAVGDILILREYDPKSDAFVGRGISAVVTYMTAGGEWEIPAHLCVLSFSVMARLGRPDSGEGQ